MQNLRFEELQKICEGAGGEKMLLLNGKTDSTLNALDSLLNEYESTAYFTLLVIGECKPYEFRVSLKHKLFIISRRQEQLMMRIKNVVDYTTTCTDPMNFESESLRTRISRILKSDHVFRLIAQSANTRASALF